jgi:hypothetical protein
LSDLEEAIAPAKVGQGNVLQTATDEILAIMTTAYEEATGKQADEAVA